MDTSKATNPPIDYLAFVEQLKSLPMRQADGATFACVAAETVWKLEAALQAAHAMRQERDEYRTLSGIGRWHDDCRPNRHMAAREIAKSQEIINRLADRISEMELATHAMQARGQWQPMETAPKDGTWILVVRYSGSFRIPNVVRWSDTMGHFHWNDSEYTFSPTHWMPLPDAPAARTEKEE